jgi:peptidyl-dipeptidase Dcp
VLEDSMARTPAAVTDLLDRLWKPALARAVRESEQLQEALDVDVQGEVLQPWDWFYYAEQIRRTEYGLDDAELRPYFELNNVVQGAFEVAKRLYGVTFKEVQGVPLYHPEARAYEVLDRDGSHLGLFLTDYHPRASKRGGAWCGGFRDQYVRDGKDVRPIVTNVGNFTKPTAGKPALLSLEETETLFHEFGHALHSLFSRVHYASLGSVPRDFVELPSQIMENWALDPQVLALYARHYQTGKPIPAALVDKVRKARLFNQGFLTVEYLAAALLDMAWHSLEDTKPREADVFEAEAMNGLGLIPAILPRYRSGYFNHIFGGGGAYSAGYYSYIWSEVLDADAFAAFEERGLFDQATATAFRREILEPVGTREAADMYRAFRGRDPQVAPLLKRRGLD